MNKYSTVKIKISGKNVINFLRRIINKKIELLNINKIDKENYEIIVYYNDLDTIIDMKTIYEVEILEIYGLKKIKKFININKYLISFIIIGLCLLVFLSNIIFKVEVIHNDKNIRSIIYKELNKYDIKKYKFVKSYDKIEKIKENILKDYKDKIEWLEIERKGTQYIVRVEERIKNKKERVFEKRHIVASENAIIKKVEAEIGEIVRKENDYVKKGDIIISGNIVLYEDIKDTVSASGKVYGEVWYNASAEVPLNQYSKTYTGRNKNVYVIKILNKKIELFNFNKYENKETKEKEIIKNNIFPIKLVKEKQKEIKIKDILLIDSEAIELGKIEVMKKINSKLGEKEKIISIKKLQVRENNSKISIDYFVTVYKDITDTRKIEEDELDVRDS